MPHGPEGASLPGLAVGAFLGAAPALLLYVVWKGRASTPSKVELAPDRIWISSAARFAGLWKELLGRTEGRDDGPAAVLLVAHFPDVFGKLERLVEMHEGGAPVRAFLATELPGDLASRLALHHGALLETLAAERKLAKRASSDSPAASAEEWLERNVSEA